MGFNKIILMGNLTRDPEVRYTPGGAPVTRFSLAVNHRYKQGGETKDEVCFIDVVIFGKQAETAGEYLLKGKGVLVEGRLQQRRWEAEGGQKRSKHEVLGQVIRFLPTRQSDSKGAEGQEAVADEGSDEIPF